VCKGDRFVLRDSSARHTLGGGVVLDIAPPLRGRRRAERLQLLAALRDDPPAEALARWLARGPVPLARLGSGWNLGEAEIGPLLAAATRGSLRLPPSPPISGVRCGTVRSTR